MAFGKYARLFAKPRKLHDKVRTEEENKLVKKYGLKNKKEIWKAESEIGKIRKQAKKLITAEKTMQDVLINKLKKSGFKVEKINDVLSLNKEDWLKRRLQSIVAEKKFASTAKGARQLIVHKHIAISGRKVNIPSYIVGIDEEDKIGVVGIKFKEHKKGEKENEEK